MGTAKQALYVFLSVTSSALLWMAWLGWDTAYDVDPVTGSSTGPYEAWQVIGFAACVAVQAVLLRRYLRWWLAAASVSAGITAAAAVSFSGDDSGLAVVGLVLILLGSLAGTSAVSLAALLFTRSRAAVAAGSAHVES